MWIVSLRSILFASAECQKERFKSLKIEDFENSKTKTSKTKSSKAKTSKAKTLKNKTSGGGGGGGRTAKM